MWMPSWKWASTELIARWHAQELEARKLACLKCKAKVGEPCVVPSSGRKREAHSWRKKAAFAAKVEFNSEDYRGF